MGTALPIVTPDGSGQVTHPDVIHIPEGFAGHQFVLACTPYPFGNDRLENPCLRVSHDGVAWRTVGGAPDPIIAAPADERRHWSDPDLAFVEGVLHLLFRGCERGRPEADLFYVTTSDGTTWTEPVKCYSGSRVVSPALAHSEGQWLMWHLESDSKSSGVPARLVRSAGPSLSRLHAAVECTLSIPGYVPWHIDVIAVDDGWEALCAAYPVGKDASRCLLFHATSEDGLRFRLSSATPVLRPRRFNWASREIYRATMLKLGPSDYRVWYAGASWGNRWAIGLAEGPIDKLRPVAVSGGPSGDSVREAVRGRLGYWGMNYAPERLKNVVRRFRS